jgi:Family of unknown function (DUF6209)
LTTSPFRSLKTNFSLRENEPPPSILFRRDFKQHVRGALQAGVRLFVFYDAERLPNERSMRGDQPGWWITMFARFAPGGPITQLNLWSRTGLILTGKATDEPGEGTMMKCDLQIPNDAKFVELWFMNSGDSGSVYFDSEYGRNYRFEFATSEIDVLDAWVTPPTKPNGPGQPQGQFQARIAANRCITAVALDYFYWIVGVNPPVRGRTDLKPTSADASNRTVWENDPVPVPVGTAINFDVGFVIDGRSHTDDNNGRHYLVPDRPERARIVSRTK